MKHKYLRLAGWTTLGDWELGDAQLAWVGHGDVLEEGGAAGSSLVSLGDLQSYSVKLCSCLIVRPISRAETHWNNWTYMKCHQVMVRFTLKIYLIIVLLLSKYFSTLCFSRKVIVIHHLGGLDRGLGANLGLLFHLRHEGGWDRRRGVVGWDHP